MPGTPGIEFTPKKFFCVTVYYMENGTKESMSYIETATSVSEDDLQAERKRKQFYGFNNNMIITTTLHR
ncbi:hypothetical protein FACS189462_3760 [Spirochaetia bacterium]|nr:hypothetical protein FACS189462_3760 [Spirochaetia bacterium]